MHAFIWTIIGYCGFNLLCVLILMLNRKDLSQSIPSTIASTVALVWGLTLVL